MSQYLHINDQNPQKRLIKQVVERLQRGEVIAYPTDSCYALGCHIGDKNAMERICRIRQMESNHHFTLVCRDLSELSLYAKVDNAAFRLMKSLTPGAYTFVLKASREVPRRLQHPKRRTIGLRVPDNVIAQAILTELNEPLMSATLSLPDADMPETEPDVIYDKLGKHLDVVIDGGHCGFDATTVIDLTEGIPQLIRQGKGATDMLELD